MYQSYLENHSLNYQGVLTKSGALAEKSGALVEVNGSQAGALSSVIPLAAIAHALFGSLVRYR